MQVLGEIDYKVILGGLGTLLALVKGERDMSRSDWYCLCFAIAAIPLWIITSTPLWSVLLITVIDAVGFYPTIRKSYYKPSEETASTYVLASVKCTLSIAALETFSVVTALYPASLVIMNGAFVAMLLWRRKVGIKRKENYG